MSNRKYIVLNFTIKSHKITAVELLNLMIEHGLLTEKEAQVCLMTSGDLPDDIMIRIKKFKEEHL